MNLSQGTYAVILGGALAWCSVLLLAPYLASSASVAGELLYRSFGSICHQVPERSFHLFGEKLGVCSRCSSIYFAFLAGVIVYPLIRNLDNKGMPHRNILFIALLPMLVDVSLEFFGIHDSTFVTRAISGSLFGLVIPFFILPAAVDAVQQLAAARRLRTTIIEQ